MSTCKAKTKSGTTCKNPPQEGSLYCHIKSHQEQDESKLNPKQERFCQLYVSKEFFGNGTESYAEAYGIDTSENYNTAKVNASKILTNTNILNRINELLDDSGLNEQHVDKQHLFLINQNADLAQKMAAIREFNKVKGRITDKIEHSGQIGGQIVIIGGDIDEKEWQKKATSYMEAMLKVVADMKEAVDGS